MLMDPAVVTDLKGRGIDKRYSGGLPEPTPLQIRDQWHQNSRHQFDKPVVTDQSGEFTAQTFANVFDVIILECSETRHMKIDQDRHNFTQTQTAGLDAFGQTLLEQESLPKSKKCFTKVINLIEYVQQHWGLLVVVVIVL
jgi:hypothetical protein